MDKQARAGQTPPPGKRQIEIFHAGCATCRRTIESVQKLASHQYDEVKLLDTHDPHVAERAQKLGILSVPAVVINGKLAACCTSRGPDEAVPRSAGLGQPYHSS